MVLFYLSFQRSPPGIVAPGDFITFSPTIVSDLREEVYQPEDGPTDIHAAWLREEKQGWSLASVVEELQWDGPSSAYKPCQIAVPRTDVLRTCQDIRLALWTGPKRAGGQKSAMRGERQNREEQKWVFDVDACKSLEADHVLIVPVLSASIKVQSNRANIKGEKTSTTSRLFWVGEEERAVEICEESGYELDKHIWDASLHLSSLMRAEIQAAESSLSSLSDGCNEVHIVELGAGTGLVTILLAVMIAQRRHAQDRPEGERGRIRLTATDLSSALPLLKHNICLNQRLFRESGVEVECCALDWSDESMRPGVELVIVSDCTYNPTYFPPLCATIASLLASGKQSASCLLAKKHRHSDEEALWDEVATSHLAATLLAGRQAVQETQWGLWKLTRQ